MKKESIIGTILILVGLFVIVPLGFAFPEDSSIMMFGVYSVIGGGILLFVANGKGKQSSENKEVDFVECKKIFDTYAEPFIKEELMFKIYESDKLCICNVANVGYYVFPYDYSINGQYEYPIGITFTPKILDEIIEEKNKIGKVIEEAGSEYVSNHIIMLYPDIIDTMYEVKHKTDTYGPELIIDYEWEERIKNV